MATLLLTNCGMNLRLAAILQTIKTTTIVSKCKYSTVGNNNNNNNNSNNNNNNSNINTTSTSPFGIKPNANEKSKSTGKRPSIKDIPDAEIKKSVFISQSYDIFTNLALEDWFYKNFDFSNHHVLMLWSNDPCVVCGRHQNPFAEANINKLKMAGIELARRNSGGGTVYHDRGNMNLTFFTPRERYNRTYNLNIITRALFREWGIKADISERDDITIFDKKISGTAAKLGQPNAYHHCTLLVDSNKSHLQECLIKTELEMKSKATASVRAPVKNLVDVNRHVNMPQLLSAVGYEFLRTSATELNDGGRDLMMKQRGFQSINPTEKWFPGLMEIRDSFSSWDWCYGKTPEFTVRKDANIKSDDKEYAVKLNVEVNGAKIQSVVLQLPNGETIPVVTSFQDKPYSDEYINDILTALKNVSSDNVELAINDRL